MKGKGHPPFFNTEIGYEVVSPLLWPYWHFLHVSVPVSVLTEEKIALFFFYFLLVYALLAIENTSGKALVYNRFGNISRKNMLLGPGRKIRNRNSVAITH